MRGQQEAATTSGSWGPEEESDFQSPVRAEIRAEPLPSRNRRCGRAKPTVLKERGRGGNLSLSLIFCQ